MGVSGWWRMGLSDSSTSPTNRWPLNTVRPFSGKAGVTMAKSVTEVPAFGLAPGPAVVDAAGASAASSAIKASATGPMLPRGVESKVEQTLK